MMRISNKLGIVLLAILLATSSILAACSSDDEDTPSWAGNPVVQTLYGTVEGFGDDQNTWVWKAIPYAKPPVDKLR
ncbi:MAG: carboxylesterase family protein, partial [Chloroflexi bacterium]|nr:carboxylesterase family protein [Chloroflexota bacterium]